MTSPVTFALKLAEKGYLSDALIRKGIQRLCKSRLEEISEQDCEQAQSSLVQFVQAMAQAEIAPLPEKANAQHYEVPANFYQYCLGRNRKYSSCFWLPDTRTLDEAEQLALTQTCAHAQLQDGQHILELGCGWGSLTLWMASHYPQAQITGVSNSASQREYIMSQAKARGLSNIHIITADMNVFDTEQTYDRIVSVEMFEHMRNYQVLYGKVARWLKPGGLFFKHIFVHRYTPYAFDVKAEDDWMSQYFFSGGMMPSDDLPLYFQDDLKLVDKWRWDGTHYEKTANAWLQLMDKNHQALTPVLASIYGQADAEMWRQRWRIFFMACAELFGYNHGQTWWVSHYLFAKR
ncbi:cyclopropane-fatty-acyl-phospholipid synthase family protein [Methylophilus sp. YYY-1]|uniref:SAM-dependent methyltransferase n=1 Tax=Methylophilus sp. YYY-1 TaxID=2682087 RepID=UPI0023B27B32|nr:cyclopropane-fatty-acyl-phospholipid synthase family protein [Methylophilus sp. YYY-1]MDF0376829.1 methyltransferase domain-containing protein [Methylophilus sp. YYY-1]